MSKDFIKLSKKWFDNQAEVYDEKDELLYSKYGKISCKNIAEYLKNQEYEKLLDIGSGTGYLINLLSEKHEAQYTGVVIDDFLYRTFSNTGDCNVSYLEKMQKDMLRNGFKILHSEKVSTFIYTIVGKK